MDDFDFDELDGQTPKKNKIKAPQKKQTTKKNDKSDDFFDFDVDNKAKPVQQKKNHFDYGNMDSYLDEIDKKQSVNKNADNKKSAQSTLPRINSIKSSEVSDKKVVKNKMDLSLQQLPQKRTVLQKQRKNPKKQSEQFDYAVYGTEQKQPVKKSSPKAVTLPLKQEKKVIQLKPKVQPPKIVEKNLSVQVNNKKPVQIKKQQPDQDQYEQQYQQEIADSPKKPIQVKKTQQQKQQSSKPKQSPKQIVQKKKPQSFKPEPKKQSSQTNRTKPQATQQKINKYKQMVEKSFPQQQNEEQVKKMKPDAINRLNDKMRDMIKGFSTQLTNLIDKNLLLLKRPENQIREEIQGEATDPIESQIKILEQTKKNNEKMLQISQRQLQNVSKQFQKMSGSAQSNVQMTEQIQAVKKYIAITSRQNSNLKNDIQKEGKKVVKLQQTNKQPSQDPQKKSNTELYQKLTNHKIQFQKNKKKIIQLNEKINSLQEKIASISSKKNDIFEKASAQGINFCSKQELKKYQQLKKKREQLVLFQSKHNTSVKSKEVLIQKEISDLQLIIEDFQKRYQVLSQQADISKEKILQQIKRAKKNPKITANTKEILSKLQLFMSEDNPNQSEQQINSLNLISQKIYKKQYQKTNSKSLTQQKEEKKVAYKNYIQEVARLNSQNKAKFSTIRRNSQQNPFRKSNTANESSLPSHTNINQPNKQRDSKAQQDKQRQRVWKSSQTQSLIRNPLKKDPNSNRYDLLSQQNPLYNKEIIKLIDKNKEKIVLKEEQKNLAEQGSSVNKKPFSFRASLKSKEKEMEQNANILAQIPKKMKQIEVQIQVKKNQMQKENKIQDIIGVKLKDKQPQSTFQKNQQPKLAVNSTPFKNIKLKKDKQTEQSKNKIQENKSIQEQLKIPQKQKQPVKQSEQATSFKPKRFNIRKKNESEQNSYMPSARNEQTKTQSTSKISQTPLQFSLQVKTKANEPIKSIPTQKKQDEPFDPFKKFMVNKEQKAFSFAAEVKAQPLKLNQDKPPQINIKPRMNLFRKSQKQETQKKMVLLTDPKNTQTTQKQQQKFINPYAVNKPQEDVPKVQRQGRLKKANPAQNSQKPANKNIFGDVEDATALDNIKSIGEPQIPSNKNIKPNPYQPKTVNEVIEPDLNDLLGIKKKNNSIDTDLLLDLPNDDKKGGIKKKPAGKATDFFGDMGI